MMERRKEDIRITKMEKDIEHIKKNAKVTHDLVKHVDDKIDSLGDKFASKYVEKAFWFLLATITTSIIGAIIALIFKT